MSNKGKNGSGNISDRIIPGNCQQPVVVLPYIYPVALYHT